ncbi:MAG: hypothetical protein PHH54_01680 [Candidatus Nanoarchaeia archaeon]|nr:hypothetical protein [Candidatus Nanoarchaeia archaeon]MDD5740672.1 hypothetical protein [Candidatus Nanoarchaeia archaeon]
MEEKRMRVITEKKNADKSYPSLETILFFEPEFKHSTPKGIINCQSVKIITGIKSNGPGSSWLYNTLVLFNCDINNSSMGYKRAFRENKLLDKHFECIDDFQKMYINMDID